MPTESALNRGGPGPLRQSPMGVASAWIAPLDRIERACDRRLPVLCRPCVGFCEHPRGRTLGGAFRPAPRDRGCRHDGGRVRDRLLHGDHGVKCTGGAISSRIARLTVPNGPYRNYAAVLTRGAPSFRSAPTSLRARACLASASLNRRVRSIRARVSRATRSLSAMMARSRSEVCLGSLIEGAFSPSRSTPH